MTPRITDLPTPAGATVDAPVPVAAPVNITAFAARQKANVFVIMEIGDLLRGAQPELVVGERPCWSVPVVLGFPDRGFVGKVGEILVDATTGELLVEKDTAQRIRDAANRLATGAPP